MVRAAKLLIWPQPSNLFRGQLFPGLVFSFFIHKMGLRSLP